MNGAYKAIDEACRNAQPVGRVVSGAAFCLAVRKALGLNAMSQRIIIDAKCDSYVKVYVQFIGDDRLLSLDLETLLKGTEVIDDPNSI